MRPFGPYWALGQLCPMNSEKESDKIKEKMGKVQHETAPYWIWVILIFGPKKTALAIERVFGEPEAEHWKSPLSSSSLFPAPYEILPMGSNAAAADKTEEDLRKEIDELQRQQREVLLLLFPLCLGFLFRYFLSLFRFIQWCIDAVSDYRTASWSSRTPERGLSGTWAEKFRP